MFVLIGKGFYNSKEDIQDIIVEDIDKKFGIRDCRTIGLAVCDSMSKKKLAKYLKKLI